MKYFDRDYLKQYIDQGVKLRVFANYDWYQVTDASDLASTSTLVGYDDTYDATEIDYRDIEEIKVGNKHYTIDQLNGVGSEDAPDKETTPKPGGEDTEEPPAEEEPVDKGPKEPDLSHFSRVYDLGRNIIAGWREKNG